MATPEKKVKDMIKKWCEDNNYYFVMPIAGKFGRIGIPDFIICANGLFIGVEAKAVDKKDNTTKMQEYEIKKIIKSGGIAVVVSCKEELDSLDKQIREN